MSKLINGKVLTEEECFLEHQKLIGIIVKKYLPFLNKLGVEKDEAFNEGSIGLIKAYRKFDESYGCKFSTYAYPTIHGYVLRFIRDKSRNIRVTRSVLDLSNKIKKEGLEDQPVKYIADKLEVKEKDVELALLSRLSTKSIDEEIYQDDNSNSTLGELLGKEADYTEIHVKDFLDHLPPDERKILEMRLDDKTQVEIARKIGVSQVQISRRLIAIGNKYIEFSEESNMIKENDKKEKLEKQSPVISRRTYDRLLKDFEALQEEYRLAKEQLESKEELILKQQEEIKALETEPVTEVKQWEEKYLREKEAHEYLFKYMSLVKGA